MLTFVRRRMTLKQQEPQDRQEALPAPPLMDMESPAQKRQVYLLTFPHPRPSSALTAPGSLNRQGILEKLFEACAAPCPLNPHNPPQPVSLERAAVFRELHKPDAQGDIHTHYHIVVKGTSCFRFVGVKTALQRKFGLASHWSCTHTGYWSPIKYCAVPSPSKPRAALDPQPLLWSREGPHPPLHLVCHEPQTASAMRAKRQRVEDHAAENSKAEPRANEYDLWPIVVESGIRNTPEDRNAHLRFIQYVKAHCSTAVCSFVFRNRARLPSLIDDIWRWETIDDVVVAANATLSQTLVAAMSQPCVCGGAWWRFASYSLGANGVDVSGLCKAVMHALSHGRSPTSPVITLAGLMGGEGKSFFFNCLHSVFGGENVFHTPQHPTFPLYGLDHAKLVYLDDFRFLESTVPMATQCLWFGGSPVPVAKPQNAPGAASQDIYRGRAPIFITTSLADIDALVEAGDGDASMLLRRLFVVRFTTRVVKPVHHIPECAACFARFITTYSA